MRGPVVPGPSAGRHDPLALKLQMQLDALDRADAAICVLDTRIRTELADYQRPLQLLQTIPGIDAGSACTILVEIGPDLGAFRQRAMARGPGSPPAARRGRCPN